MTPIRIGQLSSTKALLSPKVTILITTKVVSTQLLASSTIYPTSTAEQNQKKPSETSSTTPNLIMTPTQVFLLETATPTPVMTATRNSTQTPIFNKQAVPICAKKGQITSLPKDFGIEGTIIYQSSNHQGLFTIGGNPLQKGQIEPKQTTNVYGFSPDGEWLAYAPEIPHSENEIVFGTPTIILLSASKKRIEQNININGLGNELQDRCRSCRGYEFIDSNGEWINNTLIYLDLGATGDIGGGMYSSLPKIFDVFTGIWQNQWFGDLPELYRIIPTRVGIDHIKLSPDLSRVLYPAKSGGIILRDLVLGKELWSDNEFFRPSGEIIQWSPDSKMVAVINLLVKPEDRKLLLITRDGGVIEIVNAIYPQSNFVATNLRWSPDSRYLAYIDSYKNVNFYLFDTQTNNYVYNCPIRGTANISPSLVWSPDSKWIAFGDQTNGPMQLLNKQTGEVYELLENATPVGWSRVFPVEWP